MTFYDILNSKCEQKIEDIEDAFESEKKVRMDLERLKRKLESEARLTTDHLADVELEKQRSDEKVVKSEAEYSKLAGRMEDLEAYIVQMTKKMNESQIRNDELDEELHTERITRQRIEKQKNEIARQLDEMGEQLDESTNQTANQIELSKRREGDMAKLRRDLEESNLAHEALLVNLRKKHAEQMGNMSENIDNFQRLKQKLEKEKTEMKMELDDMAASVETLTKVAVYQKCFFKYVYYEVLICQKKIF